MTREEAVEELNRLIQGIQGDFGWNRSGLEALRMAIEALQQEPCEDCISRAEALKIMASCCDHVKSYSDAWEMIKKLQSVQPKSEDAKFLEFLWHVMNPNEMEQYLAMYHSKGEKANG